MFCLPAGGAAGAPPFLTGPTVDLESSHGLVPAPPVLSAYSLPGGSPSRAESIFANRPGGPKGLGDEDDDHTTNAPTAWFDEESEEDDQLPDALARQPVESSPDPVHPDGSLVFGNRLSNARGLIPGTIPPRSGNVQRDGPRGEGSDDDPSFDARPVPVFSPFAISLYRFIGIHERSGACRDGRISAPGSVGRPDFM